MACTWRYFTILTSQWDGWRSECLSGRRPNVTGSQPQAVGSRCRFHQTVAKSAVDVGQQHTKFCVQLAPLHTRTRLFSLQKWAALQVLQPVLLAGVTFGPKARLSRIISHPFQSCMTSSFKASHLHQIVKYFGRKPHVCELECYAAMPWPSVFSQSLKRLQRPGFAATPSWRRHAMGFRDWVRVRHGVKLKHWNIVYQTQKLKYILNIFKTYHDDSGDTTHIKQA
jgi:hypothetical protein